MAKAKVEALNAIEHARRRLLEGSLGDLDARLLVATLEFAAEQVEAIQEVRRVRRAAPVEVS